MAVTDDEILRLRQTGDQAVIASRQQSCLALLRIAFQAIPRFNDSLPPSSDDITRCVARFVDVAGYLQVEQLLDRLGFENRTWAKTFVPLLQLCWQLREARRTLTAHRHWPRPSRKEFEQFPENQILEAQGVEIVYDTTYQQQVARAAEIEGEVGPTVTQLVLNLGMLTEAEIGVATQAAVDAVVTAYRHRDERCPTDAGPSARSPQKTAAASDAKGSRKKRKKKDDGKPSQERIDEILAIILAKETPLQRAEIVEALEYTSEGRLGKNLAWMKRNNLLVTVPGQGYWPFGVSVPK